MLTAPNPPADRPAITRSCASGNVGRVASTHGTMRSTSPVSHGAGPFAVVAVVGAGGREDADERLDRAGLDRLVGEAHEARSGRILARRAGHAVQQVDNRVAASGAEPGRQVDEPGALLSGKGAAQHATTLRTGLHIGEPRKDQSCGNDAQADAHFEGSAGRSRVRGGVRARGGTGGLADAARRRVPLLRPEGDHACARRAAGGLCDRIEALPGRLLPARPARDRRELLGAPLGRDGVGRDRPARDPRGAPGST